MAVFDIFADMAIDAAGGGRDVFGSKPGVAEYVPTDLATESKKAAGENIQNMPEIQALLEKILPGYGEMQRQGSKTTLSLMRGELPDDVMGQVRRSSAYRSLMGGFSGSGMSKTLTARDIGRTSLDLMEMGGNSAERWSRLGRESVAPWLVTGPARADQTTKNNLYRSAVEQFKYNIEASPDPAAAGKFNTISTIAGTAASFGMGALGGMGGGKSAATPAGGGGYVYPTTPIAPTLDLSAYAAWGG